MINNHLLIYKNSQSWEKDLTEEGQGLIEYALIVLLVAIAVIAVLAAVGINITEIFGYIANALETA